MLTTSMSRPADAEIVLHLISAEAGGKTRSSTSGYMPNVAIRDDYLTSVKIELLNAPELAPGGECRANVWFITPEIYPNTLWPEREIIVSEATHVVGKAIVLTVFNSVLLRNNG